MEFMLVTAPACSFHDFHAFAIVFPRNVSESVDTELNLHLKLSGRILSQS